MSNLSMTQAEEKALDSKLEQDVLNWAKTRQAEAEQLAMDSARLMACTTDRLDKLKNQGFFKRCWTRFNGDAGAMERANVNDLIQMQKMSFRYVNMLQEQQLLMAHSLLSLKNNLNSLAIKEEETRQMIGLLADRTKERFEKLENRVDQLEISTNLQGWLLGLEERDYDEKYPTEYMRLFRVINDFYQIKNDNWNYNDLMFMRKAIRTVGLDPKWKLSVGLFLNSLIDEVQRLQNGHETYRLAISEHAPDSVSNYSQFAIENISSPVFLTLHGVNTHYADKMEAIEALQESLSVSKMEALKVLLRTSIKNLNVNLDYEFPLAETAIEILGCMRLSEKIYQSDTDRQNNTSSDNSGASFANTTKSTNLATDEKAVELFEIIGKFLSDSWQKFDGKNCFDITADPSSISVRQPLIDTLNYLGVQYDPQEPQRGVLLDNKFFIKLREDNKIRLVFGDFSTNEYGILGFDINNRISEQSNEDVEEYYIVTDASIMGVYKPVTQTTNLKIDLNKIKDLDWNTTQISLGSTPEDIDDISPFGEKLLALNNGIIFQTRDMKNWDKLSTIHHEDFRGCNRLDCINNMLIASSVGLFGSGHYYYSDDGKEWINLSLPEKYLGENIGYGSAGLRSYNNNFLYNGKIWIAVGRYMQEYTYTKSGIIFDSTEKSHFYAAQLCIGKNLQDFRTYTFSDDYFRYNVEDIVVSGKYFYAYLKEDQNNDYIVLSSPDGVHWDKIAWNKDEPIYGFSPSKAGILINSNRTVYEYSPDTKGLMILDVPDEIKGYWGNNFVYFKENNLYLLNDEYNSKIRLSNDIINWREIDTPCKRKSNFTILGTKLIFKDGNTIFYSDMS